MPGQVYTTRYGKPNVCKQSNTLRALSPGTDFFEMASMLAFPLERWLEIDSYLGHLIKCIFNCWDFSTKDNGKNKINQTAFWRAFAISLHYLIFYLRSVGNWFCLSSNSCSWGTFLQPKHHIKCVEFLWTWEKGRLEPRLHPTDNSSPHD